jgi:hypothetical protein
VVERFAARCLGAYTAQGSCGFSAGARWRCDSKIVGALSAGSPSAVSCRAGRARAGFKVAISLPIGPHRDRPDKPLAASAGARAAVGPSRGNCIDGSAPGQLVPPAGPPNDVFEIHTYGSVPLSVGSAVQAKLVSHSVAARLLTGLGVKPRGYPKRVPIYLLPGSTVGGGNDGETNDLCDGTGNQGSVVAAGYDLEYVAAVAAHELVHVYGDALKPTTAYPWFEDPVADWSVFKAGFATSKYPATDVFLQYPYTALDTLTPEGYRYAMWRFVQYLDDNGMIVGSDGSWPLVRQVFSAKPAMTAMLDQVLVASGTKLGRELAAFWGEHLKQHPARPPQLKPSPPANSREFKVTAGRRVLDVTAKALHTSLTDFKLAGDVKRVEFEFEPPGDGYFWGLVAPDESRRFEATETVSFCTGGADKENRKWPGHFAVTFTNGILSDSNLTGHINVYAQTKTDQCSNPDINRACRVMRQSGAESVLGPSPLGGFRGAGGVESGRPYELCVYTGRNGVGTLHLERWKSSTDLRRSIVRSAKRAGWKPVDLGDTAASFQSPNGRFATVAIAIGRDKLDVVVSNKGGAAGLMTKLARPAARLVR